MKSSIKSFSIILSFTVLFLGSAVTHAASGDLANLVNIAGKQRMLSQKIAKSYFFYGTGIRPDKTRKQLLDSINEFNKNFDVLQSKVGNKGVQDMLIYLDMAKGELDHLVKAPFNKDNASLVLDYSETLLEGSQDIVARLEDSSKLKKEAIVGLSGRQRMLTQRIAKYYIAYQAGFRDHNTIEQLKTAVIEFEQAHSTLRSAKRNTSAITAELNKVDKLWKVVAKFYKDVERGGLPIIVLATTDDIMASMNRVTGMYVKVVSS